MFRWRYATSALIGLTLFFSLMTRAEQAPTVDVFVPTDRQNPHLDLSGRLDRSDSLHLEFAAAKLSAIPEIIRKTKAVLPEFDAEHPPIVPFYIAKHRSEEERASMVAEAERQLQEAFPGLKPIIRVHLIDDREDDVREAAKVLNEKVEAAAKQMPQDEITADGVARMKMASEQAMKDTLEQMGCRDCTNRNAGTFVDKLFKRAAALRALIALGSRGVQAVAAGTASTGSVVAGISLIGFDAAWEYYFSRYELYLVKAFMGKTPQVDATKHPFLARLAQFMPTFRATGVRTFLSGLARPGIANVLAHAAAPASVPVFGGAQYVMLGGISLAFSTFYFAGYHGTEALRQKGWISGPWAEFILRAPGFVAMIAGLALSAPHPLIRAAAPVLFGTVWAVWGITYLISKVLPPRTDKLILVDSALGHYRARINAYEALEETEVTSLKPEELAESIRKLNNVAKVRKEHRKKNNCFSIFGGMAY